MKKRRNYTIAIRQIEILTRGLENRVIIYDNTHTLILRKLNEIKRSLRQIPMIIDLDYSDDDIKSIKNEG